VHARKLIFCVNAYLWLHFSKVSCVQWEDSSFSKIIDKEEKFLYLKFVLNYYLLTLAREYTTFKA